MDLAPKSYMRNRNTRASTEERIENSDAKVRRICHLRRTFFFRSALPASMECRIGIRKIERIYREVV